jgi:hypothetical protein
MTLAGRIWPAGRSLETPGLDNVGSLTSHNPIGLQGLLKGWFTFFLLLQLTMCTDRFGPENHPHHEPTQLRLKEMCMYISTNNNI